MAKQVMCWHTNKLDNGAVMIAVDVPMGETLFGLRHAVSEHQASDKALLRKVIEDMGRVAAATLTTSRACAFGG